jgi:glycosyltransferase involved in cell wall biosynthesis
MKILLSVCYLLRRSGAELFVRDLALAFTARGHSVVVYAPVMGDMVEELRLRCVACVTDLASVTDAPQIIIGSTQHETVSCLAQFPDTPAISICHDRTAAHGQPPLFSRVCRHVAVDANCRERLVFEHGIPESAVAVIHNGVDLDRFRPRPPLPERPTRAAIFSNYATRSRDTEVVADACAQLGIRLEVIGAGVDNQAPEPALLLPGYDLVFAKARCAMEAMAVGCAVVLLNEGMGLAGLVTPGNVREWHRWNFGRRLLQQPIEAAAVREAIARYRPDDAAAVSSYLRSSGSLAQMADAFETLAETVVAEAAALAPRDPREEQREFARFAQELLRPPGPASVPVQIGLLLAELEQERRLRTASAEQERAAREAQARELALLCERWRLVQRSLSWRITAPLRWVGARFREPA